LDLTRLSQKLTLFTGQKSLLELRNSEYTKSRLINHDPAEPADWVTLDWAENARDNAVAELTKQMEKLTTRAEKAEKAKKDAERECTEAKRLCKSHLCTCHFGRTPQSEPIRQSAIVLTHCIPWLSYYSGHSSTGVRCRGCPLKATAS